MKRSCQRSRSTASLERPKARRTRRGCGGARECRRGRLLIDSSLRVLLLAGIVGGLLAALRIRSNGLRHAAWSAVVGAMLLMPVALVFGPAVTLPVPVSAPNISTAADGWIRALDTTPQQQDPPAAIAGLSTPRPTLPGVSATRESPAWSLSWESVVLVLYGTGTLFLLLRLTLGGYGARRLARDSTPVVFPKAGRRPPWWPSGARITESRQVAVPVTVGAIAPTIVLPIEWSRWPDVQLRAVVEHERAHVARHDPITSLLARLNASVFWFHPLAWWLKQRLADTAEHACDESAVRAIGTPATYAEVLRDMAATVRRQGGRLRWQGVGIDGNSLLAHRIEHVLRGPRGHAVSRIRKVATAACCGVAIVAVTACRLPDAGGPDDDTQREAEWLIDGYDGTEVAVSQADRPTVEELLLRRHKADPTGPWSARLGRFYGASMVGYWTTLTEGGPLQEVTEFDPTSAFALAAGEKLAASVDPVMLIAAAEFLRNAPSYGGSFSIVTCWRRVTSNVRCS